MQFFYIFEIRIIIMCFFRYTKSTKIETLAIEFFCNKRYRSDITDYGIAGSTYLIKGNCSRQKTVSTLQIDLLANTDCFWPLSFVSMLISGWLADIIAAVLSYFTKRLKNICVRPPPHIPHIRCYDDASSYASSCTFLLGSVPTLDR
jgi:hypothetical protein